MNTVLLHRDLSVVAEVPRARGPGGLGEAARVARLMRAFAVALELVEDLRQRLLAQPARASWRDLQPATPPLHQSRLLQRALDLLEPAQVLDRRIAQGAAEGILVDVVERSAPA